MKPCFTAAAFDRANREWGANCGPGALAAIMGMTMDEVRRHMPAFETKRYTNPSMMNESLRSIGRPWRKIGAQWPDYGLVRIQWEGPWTKPGVPMTARYRWTHWIGAACGQNGTNPGVFDVNALGNDTGWVSRSEWEVSVAPWIIERCVPKGDGKWHLTHAIEVAPRATTKRELDAESVF